MTLPAFDQQGIQQGDGDAIWKAINAIREELQNVGAIAQDRASRLEIAPFTLDNTAIKALGDSQVTIVPSPQIANMVIEPLFAILYAHNVAAYANVDVAAALTFLHDGATTTKALSLLPNDAVITNGSATRVDDVTDIGDFRAIFVPHQDTEDVNLLGPVPPVGLRAQVANKALVLALDNQGTGALTLGHASNRWVVIVVYLRAQLP